MNTIAASRVQREFRDVVNDQAMRELYYIEPIDNNLLHLKGYINGPPDTPYEGGRFYLDIHIPDTYPFSPPNQLTQPHSHHAIRYKTPAKFKCKFTTRVWHPNVSSQTGAICLDILKDQWAAAMTISSVLLSLQALLAVPEPNDPQDAVVARQYLEAVEQYKETARYWTYIFALPSDSVDTRSRFRMTPTPPKFPTLGGDLPIHKYLDFNTKVTKLVEIMNTDELTALHELSSHNWDLDRATQHLIS